MFGFHNWNSPSPPFVKWEGVSVFEIFAKRGGLDFSLEKSVGKIGGSLKKGVTLIFILGNPFYCYLSLSVRCVFCLFTPFLSVLFVFNRKNLVLLHLINRYMTSTNKQFLKRKNIVESKILISANYACSVIQIAAAST